MMCCYSCILQFVIVWLYYALVVSSTKVYWILMGTVSCRFSNYFSNSPVVCRTTEYMLMLVNQQFTWSCWCTWFVLSWEMFTLQIVYSAICRYFTAFFSYCPLFSRLKTALITVSPALPTHSISSSRAWIVRWPNLPTALTHLSVDQIGPLLDWECTWINGQVLLSIYPTICPWG